MFYIKPFLSLILKNYDPVTYYEKMVDLHQVATSSKLLKSRMKSSPSLKIKMIHFYRNLASKGLINTYKSILHRLKTDQQFLAFHSAETDVLPGEYVNLYRKQLGHYAELAPVEDSRPLLTSEPVTPIIP